MNLPQSSAYQARFTVRMMDSFVGEIPAEQFGVMPEGVATNHPAFLLAHLNIYPDKVVLPVIGRAELAGSFEKWEEAAAPGKDCLEDPSGSIYGSKDEVVGAFRERMLAAADAVEATDPSVFEQDNPIEAARERFPTVGALAGFLMGPHAMFHLGQLSTWRRCMGFGPAI